MKVEILADGAVIGIGDLDGLDPSMGVAVGQFTPTSAYQAPSHAGFLDGQENPLATTTNLAVRGPQGEWECAGVWITDCQSEIGEIQVEVLGISEFEVIFAEHPRFRSHD